MIISNITPPQVWTASSRSLTNFGSGALAQASTVQTSIAANTGVDLRSSAGIVGHMTLLVITGAGATSTCSIKQLDGTHNPTIVVSASGALQPCSFTLVVTNPVGPQAINSDATVAANYIASTILLTI